MTTYDGRIRGQYVKVACDLPFVCVGDLHDCRPNIYTSLPPFLPLYGNNIQVALALYATFILQGHVLYFKSPKST